MKFILKVNEVYPYLSGVMVFEKWKSTEPTSESSRQKSIEKHALPPTGFSRSGFPTCLREEKI